MSLNIHAIICNFRSLSKESEKSRFHPFLLFDVMDGSEISGKYAMKGLYTVTCYEN